MQITLSRGGLKVFIRRSSAIPSGHDGCPHSPAGRSKFCSSSTPPKRPRRLRSRRSFSTSSTCAQNARWCSLVITYFSRPSRALSSSVSLAPFHIGVPASSPPSSSRNPLTRSASATAPAPLPLPSPAESSELSTAVRKTFSRAISPAALRWRILSTKSWKLNGRVAEAEEEPEEVLPPVLKEKSRPPPATGEGPLREVLLEVLLLLLLVLLAAAAEERGGEGEAVRGPAGGGGLIGARPGEERWPARGTDCPTCTVSEITKMFRVVGLPLRRCSVCRSTCTFFPSSVASDSPPPPLAAAALLGELVDPSPEAPGAVVSSGKTIESRVSEKNPRSPESVVNAN
eukprot:RCo022865